MAQQFFVHALRFTFTAQSSIVFPTVAANTLRGALGMALRESDLYFSPRQKGGPSGFADPPRPFVLRAGPLNNRHLHPRELFSFDLHLFLLDRHSIDAFASAIRDFTAAGIGRTQGRAELQAINRVARDRSIGDRVWENGSWNGSHAAPVSIDLEGPADASGVARRIAVNFLTPTEMKHEGHLVQEPSFPILFARIRDRVRALASFYNGVAFDIPLTALTEASAQVRMLDAKMLHHHAERRSSRTGQRHPLGGFTGTAVYEGELNCFLPWFEAAYWTGVGRQTVWGKGAVETSVISEGEVQPVPAHATGD